MKFSLKLFSTMSFLLFGVTNTLAAAKDPNLAHAKLKSPTMKHLEAHVLISQTDKGVKIVTDVSGLKPGSVHGFHIHEKGECKGPDFKSAGDHYNPNKHPHNAPAAAIKHVGDMGNLVANDKGVARTEVLIPDANKEDIKSMIGKAVIIHDRPDDLTSQPAGDSGDRIACGLIQAGKM
ncbi:MAG: superoxide dismutase family protein [Bdellovibrionales bacterium]|nr:superoxide dismutase family protein [Bdellovibrionales bacterium]